MVILTTNPSVAGAGVWPGSSALRLGSNYKSATAPKRPTTGFFSALQGFIQESARDTLSESMVQFKLDWTRTGAGCSMKWPNTGQRPGPRATVARPVNLKTVTVDGVTVTVPVTTGIGRDGHESPHSLGDFQTCRQSLSAKIYYYGYAVACQATTPSQGYGRSKET